MNNNKDTKKSFSKFFEWIVLMYGSEKGSNLLKYSGFGGDSPHKCAKSSSNEELLSGIKEKRALLNIRGIWRARLWVYNSMTPFCKTWFNTRCYGRKCRGSLTFHTLRRVTNNEARIWLFCSNREVC